MLRLMVPFEGLMVSLYLVVSKLGLYHTWPGVLRPANPLAPPAGMPFAAGGPLPSQCTPRA